MPRKTKKQKIISSYRRKLQQLNHQQKVSLSSHNAPVTPIADTHTPIIPPTRMKESQDIPMKKKIMPTPASHTQTEYDLRLKTHTSEDLKKTLIITTLVLAFEFLVFYANLKGYL